jgi:hypothetical protein
MKKLLSVMAIFLVAAVMAFPPAAHAVTTLYLSDGINPAIIINDNAVGDLNPALGIVTYYGAIGTWLVNLTSGISKPTLGNPNDAAMDLVSFNTTSNAGGNLTVALYDSSFSVAAGAAKANMAIGGTTVGSVTYTAYLDNTNAAFAVPPLPVPGTATWIGTIPFVDPTPANIVDIAPFGGSLLTPPLPLAALFSLTEVVQITHVGAGATSFNAALDVPVPATALLLGTGLIGLVGLRYRRKRKS